MASHEAARRAVAAGYTNVEVMTDGIKGWKEAGKEVTYPAGSTGG
jgi:rhodanese-related sulfurtransferase